MAGLLKTYDLEIPMKSADRADSCPDVDRCQLELFENSETDNPSLILDDVSPGVKKLSIFVKHQDTGCDYALNIGMVQEQSMIAVGYGSSLWEWALGGCVAVPAPFLPDHPRHLLNLRYANAGAPVSLIVFDNDSGDYYVVVDRSGGDVETLTYSAPGTGTQRVTAALSQDYNTLYVCVSVAAPYVHATYYKYTYSSGSWSLSATGAVPLPPGVSTYGLDHYHVDRNGYIGGRFYYSVSGSWDSDAVGTCYEGVLYHATSQYTETYSDVNGSLYSIESGTFISSTAKRYGVVVSGSGDVVHVSGVIAAGGYAVVDSDRYVDQTDIMECDGYNNYSEDRRVTYTISAGGIEITTETTDGLINSYHVTGTTYNVVEPGQSQTSYAEEQWNVLSYDIRDGYESVEITPGGWVTRYDNESVTTLSSLSHYQEYEGFVSIGCPAINATTLVTNSDNRTTTSIESQRTVYPEEINYYSILNSFTAWDEVSGQRWYGLQFTETASGDPQWRIYRNGVVVTSSIESCLGVDIGELDGLYWRAK